MKISIVGTGYVGLNVEYVDDPCRTTENADSLMMTKWRQFKLSVIRRLNNEMASKKTFGSRNVYNPQRWVDYVSSYIGIDRSSGLYA
jgi:UDP-glucose 6-dehydrogenase